mgnify:CR=1 FL=1
MSKTTENFDFETALSALQNGQALTGKDGVLTPLIKQLTEAALAAELEAHLKHAGHPIAKTALPAKQ